MLYFEIVSAALGFLGSIIFAAALVKTPDQIRDETATYWNANPYTTSSELRAQPYFIIAFILLISGFAVNIGSKIGFRLRDYQVLVSILISTGLALVGGVSTAILYILKERQHSRKQIKRAKDAFRSQVESNRHGLRQKQKDFAFMSEFMKNALREKIDQIPDQADEKERKHLADVHSSTTLEDLLEASERFLSQT